MTLRDRLTISAGNLRRMKLRTFLTTSGVLIAIAAFVSMLSFGAGNQQYIEGEFNKLGLFSTMQVYPKSDGPDTSSTPKLDGAALDRLAAVPGVNLVYPYDALSVTVRVADTAITTKAQALPREAVATKLYSKLLAGRSFTGDSSREAMISEELVRALKFASPDSAVGKRLVVSVRRSTIDSGLAHILVDRDVTLLDRVKKIHFDSLFRSEYRSKVIHTEANEVVRRFLYGFVNAQETINDTLTICGVRQASRAGRVRGEPVIIPVATAARFSTSGIGGSPAEVIAAMSRGTLFAAPGEGGGRTYSQVTIDFDPKVPYKTIKSTIESFGYRTFSFAEQFEEIQRAFLYFDLALGLIGLIALVTASLGIVNTMIMSITERRKEIGILKSLGAYENDIRGLFLVESAVIGCIGTSGGILFGWLITRMVSALAQAYMRKQGVPEVDLFALPVWLIAIALAVGIGVSIAAGFYPAARASRVDPVEALRDL
jgi:putative ABC transport system permease protein